jgi:hypothetical protein
MNEPGLGVTNHVLLNRPIGAILARSLAESAGGDTFLIASRLAIAFDILL